MTRFGLRFVKEGGDWRQRSSNVLGWWQKTHLIIEIKFHPTRVLFGTKFQGLQINQSKSMQIYLLYTLSTSPLITHTQSYPVQHTEVIGRRFIAGLEGDLVIVGTELESSIRCNVFRNILSNPLTYFECTTWKYLICCKQLTGPSLWLSTKLIKWTNQSNGVLKVQEN